MVISLLIYRRLSNSMNRNKVVIIQGGKGTSFNFSLFIRDNLIVLLDQHLFPSSACIDEWRGALFKSSRKYSRGGLSGGQKIG